MSADASASRPLFAGRYSIEASLGCGSSGDVVRARDTVLRRPVAIKRLAPGTSRASAADGQAARLVREARAVALLNHPHVVAIYDVGEEAGAPFIVMELVDGGSLRDRMNTKHERPMTLEQSLGWLSDMADALACAHRNGLVHRDIKPENLLLSTDGRIKIADFGAVRELGGEDRSDRLRETFSRTREGIVIGTPDYMAPEQLRGEELDGRTDQYAWGLVAYELLAGVHPYDAGVGRASEQIVADNLFVPLSLRERAPAVSRELEQLIFGSLSAERRHRLPDMTSVKAILDAARAVQPSMTLDENQATQTSLGRSAEDPRREGFATTKDKEATAAGGAVIGGRYRILGELGRGGMGVVYAVDHIHTGERLAMKVLVGEVGTDRARFERFKREARALARVRSDHVVRITDADVAPELGGAPFLVMEALAGVELEREAEKRGPLPPPEVVSIVRQIAAALDRAHENGVVHRDLKPENVFLHRREDGSVIVKVLDFGMSKIRSRPNKHDATDAQVTGTGAVLGTPLYMSPEQARGDSDLVSPATDIWALGLIAARLLLGRPYWRADTFAELMAQILRDPLVPPSTLLTSLPKTFDAWFLRSCDRDPRARWRTAGEQAAALAEVFAPSSTVRMIEESPKIARPPGPGGTVKMAGPLPPPRKRLAFFGVLAVGLTLVGGSAVAWRVVRRGGQAPPITRADPSAAPIAPSAPTSAEPRPAEPPSAAPAASSGPIPPPRSRPGRAPGKANDPYEEM